MAPATAWFLCRMAKTFKSWDIDQLVLLPPSVPELVPAGHVAHFVRDLVRESLDNHLATLKQEIARLQQPRVVHRIVPAKDDLLLVMGGGAKGGNVAMVEGIEPSCCGS